MTDTIVDLQRSLDHDPRIDLTGPRRRLRDALNSDATAVRDVAALARQCLVAAGASSTSDLTLDLPGDSRLVDACRDARMDAVLFAAGRVRVGRPKRWAPQWLDGSAEAIRLATAAPGSILIEDRRVSTLSRRSSDHPADPAFSLATGHQTHRSSAQRTAVRSVALAPPGSVVHVVLPTGAGKSVVGYFPALLPGSDLTVMVVPTVAIALDQERAAHSYAEGLPAGLAWHGGLGTSARSAFRQRIKDGTQRLLITSPESLAYGLDKALLDVVGSVAQVSTLVVDEAHLLSEWGLDFRPEFQQIASLRDHLSQAAARVGADAPKVVLLTATLSEQNLLTNDLLFGGGVDAFVAVPVLRPELRYLRSLCNGREERDARLLEALRVLPRPAIVYATTVATAEHVYAAMQNDGFRRVALFVGDTGSDDRERILSDWRGEGGNSAVDVVVGTAAFGLGVDQQDVRSVIHASAPTSVGAYYQEAGRAGRDGHAAVSLAIVDRSTIGVDVRVGDQTVIGNEKAWARWTAMRSTLRAGDPQSVDITAMAQYRNRSTERDMTWNKSTLVLMARAEMIRFENLPFPDDPTDEGAWDERRKRIGIQILRSGLDEASFNAALVDVRGALHRGRYRARSAVGELLHGNVCYGTLFADEYSYSTQLRSGDIARSVTVRSCAGCPGCGRDGLNPPDPVVPQPSQPRWGGEVSEALRSLLLGGSRLLAHADRDWFSERNLREVCARLVQQGVRHIVLGEEGNDLPKRLPAMPYVVVDDHLPSGPTPLLGPALVIARHGDIDGRLATVDGTRVVLTVTGTPAPDRPDEPIERWWTPALHADHLLEAL